MVSPGEHIVETKICRLSGEQFHITDTDVEFLDRLSPVIGGVSQQLPRPTLSPRERMIRRDIWRAESVLHWNTCQATGAKILSMYSPESGMVVYDSEYWWSDDWSAYDYGVSFDFERTFFEQADELQKRVPVFARSTTHGTIENSPYINRATALKNCHLTFNANSSENILYSSAVTSCYDCVDCFSVVSCEACYDCVDCQKCTQCQHLTSSHDCRDCLLGRDLSNCQNCFGCVNLVSKQYCFNNKQLSKDEYEKKLQHVMSDISRPVMLEAFHKHQMQFPVRYMHGKHNEQVTGDYLDHCGHTVHSFLCQGCDHVRYCSGLKSTEARNEYVMDVDHFGLGITNCYESSSVGILSSNILFCVSCWDSSDQVLYSINVPSTKNCFGCMSLQKGKNAILNTAYSTQEYCSLVNRIIDHMRSTGEWGEFFPGSMCPHGYNETVGNDHAQLTKEEVVSRGMVWAEDQSVQPTGGEYHPFEIDQYDEDVVGLEKARQNISGAREGVLRCEDTGRYFRLTHQELLFHIKNKIPLPRKDYRARHIGRMKRVNPFMLYERECEESGINLQTTYAPERPEKLLCEKCYLQQVY